MSVGLRVPSQDSGRAKQMTPATLARPGVWPEPRGGSDVPSISSRQAGRNHRRANNVARIEREYGDTFEGRLGRLIEPQPNGCWLYRGGLSAGYGYASEHDRTIIVHRFVYETLVGPIPPDAVLHHTCETKACCNPAHLTPMLNGDHVSHHAQQRKARR